jgi:hypothetical protein
MSLNYDQIREENIERLLKIRDSVDTPPAVQIQAIQGIQKILAECAPVQDDRPTEADIMKKIRGVKK